MMYRVDFTSQEYYRNSAAAIAKVGAAAPVVEVHFPIVGKIWTTTTQALADQVLKDSETFTIRKDDGTVAGLRWWMPGIVRTLTNSMLGMDEPDHRRLRDIVDEAFRRRAVLEMEPRILEISDQLADELFAEGTPADIVSRYARILPLSVICELLGLPPADRTKFIAWAGGFAPDRRARLSDHDTHDGRDEALPGAASRNSAPGRWRRTDRRACARGKGRQENQFR